MKTKWTPSKANEWYKKLGWMRGCNFNCLKGTRLAGSVFVGGVEAERAIEGHIGLKQAFETGKSV